MGLLGEIRKFLGKIAKNPIKTGIVAYLVYKVIKGSGLMSKKESKELGLDSLIESIIVKATSNDKELIYDTVTKKWGVVKRDKIIYSGTDEKKARKIFGKSYNRIGESLKEDGSKMSLKLFLKQYKGIYGVGQCEKAARKVVEKLEGFRLKKYSNVLSGLVKTHYVAVKGKNVIDLTFPEYVKALEKREKEDKRKYVSNWLDTNKNEVDFNRSDYERGIKGVPKKLQEELKMNKLNRLYEEVCKERKPTEKDYQREWDSSNPVTKRNWLKDAGVGSAHLLDKSSWRDLPRPAKVKVRKYMDASGWDFESVKEGLDSLDDKLKQHFSKAGKMIKSAIGVKLFQVMKKDTSVSIQTMELFFKILNSARTISDNEYDGALNLLQGIKKKQITRDDARKLVFK